MAIYHNSKRVTITKATTLQAQTDVGPITYTIDSPLPEHLDDIEVSADGTRYGWLVHDEDIYWEWAEGVTREMFRTEAELDRWVTEGPGRYSWGWIDHLEDQRGAGWTGIEYDGDWADRDVANGSYEAEFASWRDGETFGIIMVECVVADGVGTDIGDVTCWGFIGTKYAQDTLNLFIADGDNV